MSNCLSASTASRFVEGLVGFTEQNRVEMHLADCSECRNLLVAIVSMSNPYESAPDSEHLISKWASRSAFLRSGEMIGRFIIREPIGHGGMGVVYSAHDPELDRNVAVKLLRFDYEGTRATEAKARLLREARAMARLSHPNVVTVYEVGSASGYVFIAMELLAGKTLGEWLSTSSRSVNEIVQAFVGAGNGLAAAHAAGLVHRDFKPSNLIVNSAGDAVVVDLGLVGGKEFAAIEPAPRSVGELKNTNNSSSSGSLTRTGITLGTPAYMAPEQHLGESVGPHSDQWAFSVCLYQALADRHPFAANDITTLRKHVLAGRPPPLPKTVPSRIRQATMRGLSRDAKSRFDSMADMVRALLPPRRRVWLWTLLAGSLFTVAIVLLVVSARSRAQLCSGGRGQVAEVWNRAVKDSLLAQFTASGFPGAAKTGAAVVAGLDHYFDRWQVLHRETCQAARVRRELSEDAMERSMACLERRWQDAAALTELLERAERDVIAKSEEAIAQLADLNRCRDQERLRAIVPGPRDAESKKLIGQLGREFAAAKALLDVGHPREGLTRIESLKKKAHSLNYGGTVAEFEYGHGRALYDSGRYADAETAFRESAYAALSIGDSHLLVLAAIGAMTVFIRRAKLEQAEQWQRIGRASLARSGGNGVLSRALDITEAELARAKGDFDTSKNLSNSVLESLIREFGADDVRVAEAHETLSKACNALYDFSCGEEHAKRALEIWTAHYGPEHPLVGLSLITMSNAVAKLNRSNEAVGYLRRAISILEHALGGQHSDLGLAYQFLCYTLVSAGENEEAIAACKRSLENTEATLGPDHPRIGRVIGTMGYLHFRLGHFDEAYRLYQKALAAYIPVVGPMNAWVADLEQSLGRTRRYQGRYQDAAVHFSKALEIRRQQLGPDHLRTVKVLADLGAVYEEGQEAARAIPVLEEVLLRSSTPDASGNDFSWPRAEAGYHLARALWTVGGSKSRARKLAAAAIVDYGDDEPEHAANVKRWLARR